MRVAFVSTMEGQPSGGSEFLWSRAAIRLIERGDAVACSTRRWSPTPAHVQELQRRGCETHFRTVPPSLCRRALHRFGLGWGADWRWLGRFAPDIVVISLGVHLEGIEPAAACRACGIPYVLVVQSADEHRWPGDTYLDPLREAYLGARACCFVSHGNRSLVETMLAARLPNARVVCNPFNVRYEAAPPWPADDGVTRLACVGALAPVAKGQDLLFAVLARPAWRGRPVRVSLYGAGQNARSVRTLAGMLGVADRVEFRGFTDDIERVWAEHHALVLPSRHEGMPLAVLEALLCGRVCVVTDIAGNAEYIADGDTGFLAAAPTVPLLSEALERAWTRRADWASIGARAAVAARANIPPDPAGVFVGELDKCVAGVA
ncbi:glycosyl group 1 family protein : Putative glycosyltransferase II OS=Streptomyces hygroscopicus subsp. hygroscopicus GN=hygD PE=4 SV=1: Glycos_transf_1 [Gemmataceae bacterium]|nr:glycosyl group 1 family protein : Putative glycosyltransferase II OS=Streptomyces hygroscopicus subsp. hygroscopicus GN=hygD PE=4 SV=1: Glycos_transf_1 [Gemmataceae bacterium]VTU00937.1 glycosyl group 1 family protein : Putative glycosyltransferase II OS=Streptomyces hygroscopicus subsp. hygroscopicus GN=hygD PE=4 SV=1: Glycos_transf_1 [Gemmataceae bacterium]